MLSLVSGNQESSSVLDSLERDDIQACFPEDIKSLSGIQRRKVVVQYVCMNMESMPTCGMCLIAVHSSERSGLSNVRMLGVTPTTPSSPEGLGSGPDDQTLAIAATPRGGKRVETDSKLGRGRTKRVMEFPPGMDSGWLQFSTKMQHRAMTTVGAHRTDQP